MNYLAHIYLARHSEAAMIGALLGDFTKGCDPEALSPEMRAEIRLHQAVDAFTDAHPVTRASLALFRPGVRRFAPVLLDLFHDHFLARDWAFRCEIPLPRFVQTFYDALARHEAVLPPRLQRALPRMAEQDWLGAYASLEGMDLALRRVSTRLSSRGEQFREGIQDLRARYADFEAAHRRFFPELESHVMNLRAAWT